MKKKTILAGSLAVLLAASPLGGSILSEQPISAFADDTGLGISNGFEFSFGDYGVRLTGYNNAMPEELVIPSEIIGMKVVEISKEAFDGYTNLKSVTIPPP